MNKLHCCLICENATKFSTVIMSMWEGNNLCISFECSKSPASKFTGPEGTNIMIYNMVKNECNPDGFHIVAETRCEHYGKRSNVNIEVEYYIRTITIKGD